MGRFCACTDEIDSNDPVSPEDEGVDISGVREASDPLCLLLSWLALLVAVVLVLKHHTFQNGLLDALHAELAKV